MEGDAEREDRHLLRIAVNDRFRIRRYAGEGCLPDCVIERQSGLTLGVMGWGAISYHARSNLLQIEGILNSNRTHFKILKIMLHTFDDGLPIRVTEVQEFADLPEPMKSDSDAEIDNEIL
ncbi:hypothetical protein TNCV_4563111 [Trichonephila clavipes]|uniref:Uncharacterized protein n=1 Tax=Trichonephila clavipes TaxID=2585209 RepID=A0A8X6W4N7_TRICX|nr:hypothetical protein TNCV_4563111 [Trichonephila clavipes]